MQATTTPSSLQRVRMFESDFLEKLSLVHPIVPALVWIPIVILSFYYGVIGKQISWGYAVGGLFFWTFAEYVLHRFVFHFQAKSSFGKRIQFIIHGNHHDVPNDPMRLVMPPVAGLLIATPFFISFVSLLGFDPGVVWFGGFICGYLAYDYTHYAVHHITPRTAWGRFVKRAHMVHHYDNPNTRWGVSSPLWDYIFRSF